MMTGALLGQVVVEPAAVIAGGLASHVILDAIPHADGRTFNRLRAGSQPDRFLGPDVIVAAVECVAAALIVGWVVVRCPNANDGPIALGTLAAILPDLVDQPLHRFFRVNVLHIRRLHWTVGHGRLLWGIVTQLVVAGIAAVALVRFAGCV